MEARSSYDTINVMKYLAWFLVAEMLVLPAAASAATFLDMNEAGPLSEPATDDLYIAGKSVTIDQPVEEDLFAAGEKVEVTSRVNQDVYAAGGTVHINAPVGDDLHAAGQTVEISGNTAGDVFAAGRTVVIAGAVGGSVWAAGESIILKPGATVAGDLRTFGANEPTLEEGATVQGEMIHRMGAGERERADSRFLLLPWIRSVAALFILACVLVYGARAFSRQVIETVGKSGGKSFVTGAIWMLLFIPVSIILLITLVGIPLAGGVVLITGLVCLAATGIAAAGLGRWVIGKSTKDSAGELTWTHALAGAVIYKGIQLLPSFGWLLTSILALVFFGAAIRTLFKIIRNYESQSTADSASHQNSNPGVGAA